jgi:hypothetical protein
VETALRAVVGANRRKHDRRAASRHPAITDGRLSDSTPANKLVRNSIFGTFTVTEQYVSRNNR